MTVRFLSVLTLACAFAMPAAAATVSKSYSYFTIHGKTLEEIQAQLDARGPKLRNSNERHPGATRMEFKTHVGYRQRGGSCEVVDATVSLTAKMILPRWSQRGAPPDVKFIWDTLAMDIKRHEESHVVIARNFARDLENQLNAIRPQRNCTLAKQKADGLTDKVLAQHDAEQDRFDRIEGQNFEARLTKLLDYRLKQASGR